MFTYTNSRYNPKESSMTERRPQRPQSPNPAIGRPLTNSRAASPPTSVPRSGDKMSEKYKNHTYNRVPSPLPRINPSTKGTALSARTDGVRESPRVPQRPLSRQASLSVTPSETTKRRLETQCQEQEYKSHNLDVMRMRPKTAEHRRANVKESPSLEDKVFYAVKDAISRAVLEKGKIDQNNINAIFNDMRRRLLGEENRDDDVTEDTSVDIDVNMKLSKTSINVEPPLRSKTISIARSKPLTGIVRRNITDNPKKSQTAYRRVYNKDEPEPLKQERNDNSFRNGRETVVYVDLPDSDYSNFNSIMKKEEEFKLNQRKKHEEAKNIERTESQIEEHVQTVSRQSLGDSTNQNSYDANFVEEKVGDCPIANKYKTCDFLKTEEDVRLQTYIEALIRNMNEQLRGKQLNGEISSQTETEQTVCKSFCVCRVCVSKKTMSSKTLNEDPSNAKVNETNQPEQPKQQDAKLRYSNTNNIPSPSTASKAVKQTRMREKDPAKEPNCKVLQRNTNFQPESKLDLMSRVRGAPRVSSKLTTNSKNSYVVMANEEEELSEDSYLKRRMKKGVIGRRPNTART